MLASRRNNPTQLVLEQAELMAAARDLTKKQLKFVREAMADKWLILAGMMCANEDVEPGSLYVDILDRLAPRISAKQLDQLMVAIFELLLNNEFNHLLPRYACLLSHALENKLPQLSHLLIDNNLCDFSQPNFADTTYLISVLQKHVYNPHLFVKILEREFPLINYVTAEGLNALDCALCLNENFPVLKLLEKSNLVVSDKLVREIVDTKDQTLIEALYKYFRENNLTSKKCFTALFPAAWLPSRTQLELRNEVNGFIAEETIFTDNPELAKDVTAFLDNEERLPFRYMNRLSIIYDFLMYLYRPERIDQYNSNLCGVVCLMQHCIIADPAGLLRSVLEIATSESSRHFGQTAIHLSELWQEVMRDRYNSVLGYKADSKLARVTALTRPDQLVRMYEDMGFKILGETFQIRLSRSNTPGRFFDGIRKLASRKEPSTANLRMYSNAHQELQNDGHRLDALCALAHENCFITILVNAAFFRNQPVNRVFVDNFLGIFESSHYMMISQFRYITENDTISFMYYTWGKSYMLTSMPRTEFEKCFLGALSVTHKKDLTCKPMI